MLSPLYPAAKSGPFVNWLLLSGQIGARLPFCVAPRVPARSLPPSAALFRKLQDPHAGFASRISTRLREYCICASSGRSVVGSSGPSVPFTHDRVKLDGTSSPARAWSAEQKKAMDPGSLAVGQRPLLEGRLLSWEVKF